MCDMPSVYSEHWHCAKKEHRCCECETPIQPGQRYRRIWGVWPFGSYTFKQCERCAELFDELITDADYPEERPPFGGMRDYIDDCERYDLLTEQDRERLGMPVTEQEGEG